MSNYSLVKDYIVDSLRKKKYRKISNTLVFSSEKIIAIRDNEYLLVIQAHDEHTWRKLLDIARDPEKVKEVFYLIESSSNTMLPSTVSIMRILLPRSIIKEVFS